MIRLAYRWLVCSWDGHKERGLRKGEYMPDSVLSGSIGGNDVENVRKITKVCTRCGNRRMTRARKSKGAARVEQ